jgi:hypothetical protein
LIWRRTSQTRQGYATFRAVNLVSRLAPREAALAESQLWRRAPFVSVTAGDEMALACRHGEMPAMLPAFVIDFVLGCDEFHPIEAHLERHAEKYAWSALQVASVRSWLPHLTSHGLLISNGKVHAQCMRAVSESSPPPIGAIGFPTGGNRAGLMARALDSFIANLDAHGRTAELLISDSSHAEPQREAFRALAAARGPGVRYAGETEKRRFAAALAERAGCSPDAIEFALFDPLHTGFTCGANRNAIILHCAGKTLCSVDDDVVCHLAEAPLREEGLALFATQDPYSRWLFADRAAAFAAARPVDVDFLAQHESMLGYGLASLLPEEASALELDRAHDEILRRIEEGTPRIRASFLGHVGDPGIPTSAYYLYYDGENLDRLTASEEHYAAVFASRSVLTTTARRAIGDASVSPGMAMGLDHRELLPPFFPVLHAEDFIYGATLWRCCSNAVLGHLPVAIAHEPAPGKPILLPSQLDGERRAVVFEFAHLVRRLILHFSPARHAGTRSRMEAMGRALAEVGRLPRADFREFLRMQTLEHESERLDFLERQLRERPDAPSFWRDDVQALIEHTREALGFDDFDIPLDLKPGRTPDESRVLMQSLIGSFGALLQEWPAMVEAAQALRDEGRGMFVGGTEA